MDHVRNFLTRLKTGHHGGDENDDNILSGPNIGISPGQVKEDVHYMESRGSIDLSTLRFHAEEYPKKTQSNLNLRIPSNSTQEIIVGNNPVGYESIVDIAVFQVPEHCNSQNCDLSKYGVGSLEHIHGASYLNLCKDGRLNLDHDLFAGHHTHLIIPKNGKMPDRIKQRQYNKFSMPEAKHYEVMLANCHLQGRKIRVSGQVVFDLVDDDVYSLTKESLTVLISVAAVVFVVFTILTVRVNMGTRADFERAHYGLVPNDEEPEEGTGDHTEEEQPQEQNEEEPFQDEGIQEQQRGERVNLSMMTQATIV